MPGAQPQQRRTAEPSRTDRQASRLEPSARLCRAVWAMGLVHASRRAQDVCCARVAAQIGRAGRFAITARASADEAASVGGPKGAAWPGSAAPPGETKTGGTSTLGLG